MTSDNDEMIARSPSPPELDDDGEEWPVHGIVGEDVDVFGTSKYVLFRPFTPFILLQSTLPSYEVNYFFFSPSRMMPFTTLTRFDGKTGIVRMAPTQHGCVISRATRNL
jgi:hypothetical protein